MKVLLFLCLIGATVSSQQRDGAIRWDLNYNEQELVDYVNELQTTWTAGYNVHFRGMSHNVIRGMLGVKRIGSHDPSIPVAISKTKDLDLEIPESFDSRTQWPHCPSLEQVRDQSACGSCWAFGAVEAMSDRICIASHGRIKVELSSDDLLSCCQSCGMGCDGGEPLAAWQFWVEHGLVTGSNYTAKSGCRPYPFPPCEHHSNRTHYKPCQHELYPTPQCTHQCQSHYTKAYDSDKWYGSKAYAVDPSVEAIQKEIMTNGPVEVAFEVYEDFLHYTSGVYQHHAGKLDGGHAVKMIGWGVDSGTPYWLVANSWNSDWGLNGFFKILRGSDECGIESGAVGGIPRLNRAPKKQRQLHRNELPH